MEMSQNARQMKVKKEKLTFFLMNSVNLQKHLKKISGPNLHI